MEKELPYFKFYPDKWINGDISLLPENIQGIFINVCSYYWKRNCRVALAKLKQKLSNCQDGLKTLIENDIIIIDENENIIIDFLNEQYKDYISLHLKLSESGRKGGISKAKGRLKAGKRQAKAFAKQLPIYKEEYNKEIYKEKIEFYEKQKQICLSNGNDTGYLNLIEYLFKNNELKRPIDHVLNLECQLEYVQYLELKRKAKEYDKSVKDYLNILVDTPKYAKGKTSLYLILCKYISNDKKKKQ